MFAALASIACLISPCAAQAGTPHRVGRIIIEGNTDTPDCYVHELVRMRPGEKLSPRAVKEATERLRQSGHFVTNPWRDIGPVVEVLENELDLIYLDIRVRVEEKPLNWLRTGAAEVIYSATLGNPAATYTAGQWLLERGYQHFTNK